MFCRHCGSRNLILQYDDRREYLKCLTCARTFDVIMRVSERRRNQVVSASRTNDRPWSIGQSNNNPILPGQRKIS